tara:strand:- start:1256 stop:1468 length:213 start_codon:yes stop_codon:yes gene_type:complete
MTNTTITDDIPVKAEALTMEELYMTIVQQMNVDRRENADRWDALRKETITTLRWGVAIIIAAIGAAQYFL